MQTGPFVVRECGCANAFCASHRISSRTLRVEYNSGMAEDGANVTADVGEAAPAEAPVIESAVPPSEAPPPAPEVTPIPEAVADPEPASQPQNEPLAQPASAQVEGRSAQTAPFEPMPSPAPPAAPPTLVGHVIRTLKAQADALLQRNKRKKLDKILAEVAERGVITNDRVEKMLRVSDATATRYLSQLTKEGKLRQEGKGPLTKYRLPL